MGTRSGVRYARVRVSEDESEFRSALSNGCIADIEAGRGNDHDDEDYRSGKPTLRSPTFSPSSPKTQSFRHEEQSSRSKWTRRKRLLRWKAKLFGSSGSSAIRDKTHCGKCTKRRRPLRIVLRCLAIALMLLGLIEFIVLVAGLVGSWFPDDIESAYARRLPQRPHDPTSHWPTDSTADILPVQCHSHNDYWRPIPLQNALKAGCTGVEADVWLVPDQSTDELFVGHSRASLTPARTLKSLYVGPLVDLLEQQNPVTPFHPELDTPRNGVFDTDPSQTLVLLIDFKTDGQELWPYVSEQLEPLRQKKYLTYFNGTDTVSGPITVVATGNAPFNRVVENSSYRDIFFDAPLDLLADAASMKSYAKPSTPEDVEEKASNQGQGYSGSAPQNAAVYTGANSYYASVSFTSSIGLALPFLSQKQKDKIRQQIQGAHKQGLKVRYWDTPAWPRGLRNYIWRTLVEEGVDYLNVDDLIGATRGDWGRPRHRHGWSVSDWNIWNSR